MRKSFLFLIIALVLNTNTFGQQTVGLFQYDQEAFLGYTFFAPVNSTTTYLIDNCGDLQFTWQSAYTTGHTVELQPDGTVYRACNFQNGSPINAGGGGGRIEAIRVDQQIDWEFVYANDSVRLHHDFEVLPNGNIVMIAWEAISIQDAIDFGRDPALIGASGLWPEHLIEYNPTLDQIVWEWHSWDHVVQDFDNTKPNFGVVADHPELFDLNFDKGNAAADWQHFNAVDYNADLDQLLFSSPAWNEIYIIDHSTTTSEAASHVGGLSGKGGDILWRWGNPEIYGRGVTADRQLYGQHDAHWIPSGYRYENEIMVFNNGKGMTPDEFSRICIINPVILPNGDYDIVTGGSFLPTAFGYSYEAPTPTDFYSHNISSAEMLPNGNIFIDDGAKGHFFEVDSLGNKVWDYINPVVTDSILAQEQIIPGGGSLANRCFRARKVAHDYSGVLALPLTNQGPLERDPYLSNCITNIGIDEIALDEIVLYPSPADEFIYFSENIPKANYTVMNSIGQTILNGKMAEGKIDVSKLSKGVYFVAFQDDSESFLQVHSFVKK